MCNRYAFLTLLFTLALSTCASAQVIMRQDFEGGPSDDWNYTPNPAPYNVADGTDFWEVRSRAVNIDPFSGAMLFGGRDVVNNEGGTGNGVYSELQFFPVDITGLNDVIISFYYNVHEFDRGDDLAYALNLDGQQQDDVSLVDGNMDFSSGWQRVEVDIPAGTNNVGFTVKAKDNGNDDWFAFDNFEIAAIPCGIKNVGPPVVNCLTFSPNYQTDTFEISIPYSRMDSDIEIMVQAGVTTPNNDVTATVTNIGDDPNTVADGTIVLRNSATDRSRAFVEGNEIRITMSDGGDCNYVLDLHTTDNQCRNPCDPNVNISRITFECDDFTGGDDTGVAVVPFTNGPEPGMVVTVDDNTVTVSGDSPAGVETGSIRLEGVVEGQTYTITFTGGGCEGDQVKQYTFAFPGSTCIVSPIVINEVLVDPPSESDVNQDGTASTTRDEFVELYNTSEDPVDISGYNIYDAVRRRFTFPPGTILPGRSGTVVFGDDTDQANFECPVFGSAALSLNNDNETIIIRNASGGIVAEQTFGANIMDQSFAREPDFTGSFVPHTTIVSNPIPYSPCEFNAISGLVLPVELLSLQATATGKTVIVDWATANERDNDYFLIDRSANGVVWQPIGMMEAGTEQANRYEFTDDAPAPGTNYYRLRQVDLDGTQTAFGPVTAQFISAELSIYPNPVFNHLQLNRNVDENDVVTIVSVTGNVVRTLPAGSHRVSVADLPSGIYLLRFDRGGTRSVKRFVKQ